jgi:hypothetical protein
MEGLLARTALINRPTGLEDERTLVETSMF